MIVISGATGYLGRPLAERLVARGMAVRAIVRAGSARKLPGAVESIVADPLAAQEIAPHVPEGASFVHLVGTPRPAPWKGRQFRAVDLPAALASIEAAGVAKARHFIYVSVAHPAPVMQAYIDVRTECERALAASGVRHTILRPWYVLGEGRRWPHSLEPLYWLASKAPAWRDTARRLGLVTHAQMLAALEWAVDHRPESAAVLDVPSIKQF